MNRRRLLATLGGLVIGANAWSQQKVVRITARKFSYSPSVITLKKGEPVVLEFTTADVFMGFNAPDFNVRADIIPGEVARVPLTPDKTGTFDFLCDIFCGEGHEKMGGKIRVT